MATLSNIGNGSLANLNIPGLAAAAATTTTTSSPPPPQQQAAPESNTPAILPPALAKLLGGLVTTPTPVNPSPSPPSDPRMRNDPRQRNNWPPPQGPSITRATGERKSRWGSANETVVQQAPQQDPWLQRQNIQDPRIAAAAVSAAVSAAGIPSSSPIRPPPPPPPQYQSNPYQNTPQSNYQPSYQSSSQQNYQPQPSSYQQQRSHVKGADPVNDISLPPGCIKGKLPIKKKKN